MSSHPHNSLSYIFHFISNSIAIMTKLFVSDENICDETRETINAKLDINKIARARQSVSVVFLCVCGYVCTYTCMCMCMCTCMCMCMCTCMCMCMCMCMFVYMCTAMPVRVKLFAHYCLYIYRRIPHISTRLILFVSHPRRYLMLTQRFSLVNDICFPQKSFVHERVASRCVLLVSRVAVWLCKQPVQLPFTAPPPDDTGS